MGTVAIIGGGASGLAAATEAARAGAEVLLFEAVDRVGKPILATGNGRCNFSNANPADGDYRNAPFVASVLAAQEKLYAREIELDARSLESDVRDFESDARAFDGPHAVTDFFARLGMLRREEDGRLYPLTNKATTVVDVLRQALASYGVEERCGHRAVRVRPLAGGAKGAAGRFRIDFAEGEPAFADAVVLACGGHIARALAPEELAFVRQRPVLGPLRTDTAPIKGLNNIRVQCAIALESPEGGVKAREEGEVLFRDYGISGIAAFDVSRHAEPGDRVVFDFIPWIRECELRSCLEQRWDRGVLSHGGAGRWRPTLLDITCGMLLPQVARCVLAQANRDPSAPARRDDLGALAGALKRFAVTVRGGGDAKQCQVTRGGLDVRGFSSMTLEASAIPGLYAAGEALDVDAACGGFNLHWAWASGMLAGRVAGTSVAAQGAGERAGAPRPGSVSHEGE